VPSDLPLLLRARAAVERTLLSMVLGSPRLSASLARKRAAPVDGRTLDPQIAALLALADLVHSADLTAFPPVEARLRSAGEYLVVDGPPPPGVVTRDLFLDGPAVPIPVRLYVPPGLAAPSAAIVYFHGGGMVTGSIATHDALCRRLAIGARCRVVSVDYRLAPEHRFPAGLEDALAAFRGVVARAEELGVDPARVGVAGDSAGGNLSAIVSRKARGDAHPPLLQALLYPFTDGTASLPSRAALGEGYLLTKRTMDWFTAHYLGDADPSHPDFSVLLAPEVDGVAPALVYTAGLDPLRDEGEAYASRLRAAGVRVEYRELPSLVHGFAAMTGMIDSARRAVEEIAEAIGRELHG
jgi:acetyl esterase